MAETFIAENTKQVLKSFVPFISLQRIQDAECRHFSAINFSALYFPIVYVPEFRLQPWVAGEARAGINAVFQADGGSDPFAVAMQQRGEIAIAEAVVQY